MMLTPLLLLLNNVLTLELAGNCPGPAPDGCKICIEETVKTRPIQVPYCAECNSGYTLNDNYKICDKDCGNNKIPGCAKCTNDKCTECHNLYKLIGDKCVPLDCVGANKECAGVGTCKAIATPGRFKCVCTDPYRDAYTNCAECVVGYTLSGGTCAPRVCTGRYTARCETCSADGTCFTCRPGFYAPSSHCGSPCPIGCNCNPALNYLKCESCIAGYQLSTESGWKTCDLVSNCTEKLNCAHCDSSNACLTCKSGWSNPALNCTTPCGSIRGCLDCSPTDPNVCIQCRSATTPDMCQPYCEIPPSAASQTACAEVYDSLSQVASYGTIAFYNVRYSTYKYGFLLCNKLGYPNKNGICSCTNDPLRSPESACSECIFGYMLNRYTQRCVKDTLNTAETNCLVGDVDKDVCYTCKNGYYGVADKCTQMCKVENCIRCTDTGDICLFCMLNTTLSDAGTCVQKKPVNHVREDGNTTDLRSAGTEEPAEVDGNCAPACGPPFVCAKEKGDKWICAHPRCVQTQNGVKIACGQKGVCLRNGVCLCDDPHAWSFCTACAPGWKKTGTDAKCDTPDCFPACRNGGTCTVVDGKAVCKCQFNGDPATNCVKCLPGYTGINCNIPFCFVNEDCASGEVCVSGKCNTDPCSSNNNLKCNNHGTCITKGNVSRCVCAAGYSNETNCLTCTFGFYMKNEQCLEISTSRRLSTTKIIGITSGCIILAVLITVIVLLVLRLRKKNVTPGLQASVARTNP